MPDATQVAASQNLAQYLFYFICALGMAGGLAATWFAKYILIPVRDRHFSFLDSQVAFMKVIESTVQEMVSDDKSRTRMHEENLKKLDANARQLSDMIRIMHAIQVKLGVSHKPPEPSAG